MRMNNSSNNRCFSYRPHWHQRFQNFKYIKSVQGYKKREANKIPSKQTLPSIKIQDDIRHIVATAAVCVNIITNSISN